MAVYITDQITSREDAYALLTAAARREWNVSQLPEIARTSDGKPYFPHQPGHYFNLSHSRPFALCALDSSPVGADIQIIKNSWREGLPGRVCSESELLWLKEQPDRWRAFTLLWAMKEARAKYTGAGLRSGIRNIAVPLPAEGQTRHFLDGLWFQTYAGINWMAAVCGKNPPAGKLIWI